MRVRSARMRLSAMAEIEVAAGVKKVVQKEAPPGAQKVEAGNKIDVHCTGHLNTNPLKKFWRYAEGGIGEYRCIHVHRWFTELEVVVMETWILPTCIYVCMLD